MGCGWYLDRVHPKEMENWTVEDLTDIIVKDITEGIDGGTSDYLVESYFLVKAGIIGELGCTTNITPNEVKVLKAAARAQKITGASISIHPGNGCMELGLKALGYSKESPVTVLDTLEAEGADLTRVIIGHIDRGILDVDDMINLAKRGFFYD
jgi:phosphotriesterase-related protein